MAEQGREEGLDIQRPEYLWYFKVPTWDIYLIFLRS